MKKVLMIATLLVLAIVANAQIDRTRAFERNAKMHKGINWNGLNFNMSANLEPTIDMKLIRERGFESVRIPVHWSAFTTEDYTIPATFFAEVDRAIKAALDNDLYPFISIQSWESIVTDPDANYGNFIYLWEQIATHYANWDDKLMFEILNEPAPKLTIPQHNQFQRDALTKIRESNTDRIVIITVAQWSDFSVLPKADIPDDPNLIFTLHNYATHEITHQGARFMGDYAIPFIGTVWSGSIPEYKQMESYAQSVRDFATAYNIPFNIGEFGMVTNGDTETGYRWVNAMTRNFDKTGISYSYWDQGIYNYRDREWREPLITGLLDDELPTPKDNTTVLLQNDFASTIEPIEITEWIGESDINISLENEEVKIVTNSFTYGDDKHLSYQIPQLELGHYYAFSVDLYADSFRTVTLSSSYASIGLLVSSTKRTYSHVFRVNKQLDYNPIFRVFPGASLGNLYVDNFKIEEINVEFVNSVSIDGSNLVIDKLVNRHKLSASVLPANADEKSVKWTIEENDIATIDRYGYVRPTGKGEGTVEVFATSRDATNITTSSTVSIQNQQLGKLKNGNFSLDFSYWHKQGGRIYPEITENSSLYIQTFIKTEEIYQASLSQKNIKIEQGKSYQFSFKAKANSARDINIFIGMNDEPWTNYLYTPNYGEVNLTDEWQAYSYTLNMDQPTDEHSQIVFNFGNDTINWFLDDVQFSEKADDEVNATFSVDMQNEEVSNHGVYLIGSFCEWNPANAVMMILSEGTYKATLKLKKGETIEYKFVNGSANNFDNYEIIEGNCTVGSAKNRSITIPNYDSSIDPVCFARCSDCQTTSIEDLATKLIKVFPNPAKKSITISGLQKDRMQLAIYNMSGELMEHCKTDYKSLLNFDIGNYAAGTYTIILFNESGTNLGSYKFIKR